VLEKFPEDVGYAIKHFPLSNHKFAHQSAMAALAAGKQGKFWEFHSRLLENHNQINDAKILQIAGEMGLNMDQFTADRQSAFSQRLIQQDIENGRQIGVRGTPSVFLNGKRVHNPGKLPELIMKELEK
jgi:protein-disulfide isomerase